MSLAVSPNTPTAREMFFTVCSPRSAKAHRKLVPDLVVRSPLKYKTPPGLAERFQPSRDIDAVAKNIVAVNDDIADVDFDLGIRSVFLREFRNCG